MDYIQIGRWGIAPVTTGASTEALSVATVLRDHLRIVSSSGSSTEDTIVSEKLGIAQRKVEGRTLRPFYRAQFDFIFNRFPCDGSPIRLPRMPLVSVDSIWSFGTDGSSSQFGSSGWFIDTINEPGRVCLNQGFTWPSGRRAVNGGLIRFTAGYSTGGVSGIPDPLLEAVRKLATELYENREAVQIGNSVVGALPFGLEDMLADYIPVEVG